MLVLTRKSGESIRLGDEIVVTVVSIGPGQVRLGVEAPARVIVHREEVYERVASANRRAALETPTDSLERLMALPDGDGGRK